MKKDVIILRFGRPEIIRGDVAFIEIIIDKTPNIGKYDSIGGPFSFGTLSIFHTEFTPAEIRVMLNEAEINANDNLPTVIFYRDDVDTNITLKGGDAVALKILLEVFDKNLGRGVKEDNPTIFLSVDQLLDKISKEGISSLSRDEIKFLENSAK